MSRLKKSLVLVLLGLGLFSVARLALFLSYRQDFAELSRGQVLLAFANGLRFDLFAVFAVVALPLLLMNLPLALARRKKWFDAWAWLALALLAPVALVLAGDIIYYDLVHRHVGAELALLSGETGLLSSMAFGQYGHVLAASALLVFLLGRVWRTVLARPTTEIGRPGLRFALVLLVAFAALRGTLGRKPMTSIDAFRGQTFAGGNLTLNGVFTVVKSTTRNSAPEASELADALAVLDLADVPYPLVHSLAGRRATAQNLVVILLESWDCRFVDSYRDAPLGITPSFDQLAREGLLFDRFYAASQRSIGAVQAILVGVPSVPGIPDLGFGLELASITRLGAIAGEHGYHTLLAQAPRRRSYYMDAVSSALGFAAYFGKEDYGARLDYGESDAKYGWDHDLLQFALERLDEREGPFLAFLISGTTHSPYPELPERFRMRPHSSTGEGGYVNALHYSDWALGELFAQARTKPWYANTLFLLVSDHVWKSHERSDVPSDFRIPALLVGPGIAPGRSDVVASHLDVLPTILDALGFADPFAAMGESLLAKEDGYALVSKEIATGLLAADGYVLHCQGERLDGRLFDGSSGSARLDELEHRLRALGQVTRQLVAQNRWAPVRAWPPQR